MELPPLLWIGIFLLELMCLFFVSQMLIKSLARIFFRLTSSRNQTVTLLALLFMPGTILHELAHVLVAGVMMVPTGDIEFTPEIQGDRVKLGSAEIGKTDILRRALIGVAPVIVGTMVIIGLLWWMFFWNANQVWWVNIVSSYLIFIFSNTMFSSKKDLEGFVEAFALVMSIFVTLYLFRAFSYESLNSWLMPISDFVIQLCWFMLIPILLDLTVYGLSRIIRVRWFERSGPT